MLLGSYNKIAGQTLDIACWGHNTWLKSYWMYRVNSSFAPSQCETGLLCNNQGWGQIRFIKYKYKYKYIFFRSFKYKYKYKYTGKNLIKYKYKYKYSSSNTNTNTNTQWLGLRQNCRHFTDDKSKFILLFYLFKFHWKLFPRVQSTISPHWFR